MATQAERATVGTATSLVDELTQLARETRVFVSMPYVPGITSRVLREKGRREDRRSADGLDRYYGTFRLDEVGIPAFDHGLLYGDAVFEGVLVAGARLFQWREHVERLFASAARIDLEIPYSAEELTLRLLESMGTPAGAGSGIYLRLVATRGIGDLGVSPARCAGGTVYCVVSKLRIYDEATYAKGVRMSLAREVRRLGAEALSPQIKSCNYLNNIRALLETKGQGTQETLMLTSAGFVAEATADNIFVVDRGAGWRESPSAVKVRTPSGEYCLNGITRALVMRYAREMGYVVEESAGMVPEDLIGDNREVFVTGTAAGLAAVVNLDGRQIGDGKPGPITMRFRERLTADMATETMGLPLEASASEVRKYLAGGR